MKSIKLPTAEELNAKLAGIQPARFRRGWKTAWLNQHADALLAALEKNTYDDVGKAIREAGAPIATATLSNWAKSRKAASKDMPTRPSLPRKTPPVRSQKQSPAEGAMQLFAEPGGTTTTPANKTSA